MIQVFKKEIELGLAEKIKSDSSIAFSLQPVNHEMVAEQLSKAMAEMSDFKKQIDLFYFESILVSTGWNKNDDVFDRAELWKAKDTPINKKINYMHDESDIVGHMITSRVMDDQGKIVLPDSPLNQVSNNFDIVVGGVLYTLWENEELQNRMNQIIAEIGQGRWKVSMECVYPHFDYAVCTPEGEHKIIKRDESSAFLSQYLRRYGGTGQFENYKIGRALRDLVFSGKGLVDDPANPRSKITRTEYSDFLGAAASINTLKFNKRGNLMDITQAQYDELKSKLEKAEAAAKEAADKAVAREKETLQATIAELQKSKAAVEAELSASKEVTKAHEAKIVQLEATITDKDSKLAKANEELAEAAKLAVKAKRLAMFSDVEVTEAKAQELVDKFADASDEIFEELVKAMPKKKAEMKEDKKEDKKEEMKEKADVNKVLESAEITDKTGSIPTEDTKSEAAVRVEAAKAWLTKQFKYSDKQGDK